MPEPRPIADGRAPEGVPPLAPEGVAPEGVPPEGVAPEGVAAPITQLEVLKYADVAMLLGVRESPWHFIGVIGPS